MLILAGLVTMALPSAPPLHVNHSVARPSQAVGRPHPAPHSHQTYAVTVEHAAVRTGPAQTFEIEALLARGTKVTALEVDPRGDWLRVSLADGMTGFVSLTELRPATDNAAAAPPASAH